jgi:hypothetical protein
MDPNMTTNPDQEMGAGQGPLPQMSGVDPSTGPSTLPPSSNDMDNMGDMSPDAMMMMMDERNNMMMM